MLLRVALLTLSVGLPVPPATAQPAAPRPAPPARLDAPGTVVLWGATVIDGTGAPPRRGAAVAVAGGRITYVGDTAGVRLGPGVRREAAAGRWVLPGFVDVHAHTPEGDAAVPFLATLVAFGTTTARAPANPRVELRALVASGRIAGPRLFVAGRLIHTDFGERVTTAEAVRAVVRRQAAEGVDWIKLYAGLPPALVAAGIDEAHRHRLRVVGHLGRTTWGEAAALGIDALTHSWYAGLAHSVVPAREAAAFRDFYIPNGGRFDPGLFRRWREIVDPDGPDVRRLADLLRARRVSVDPNLVHGEAVTWGDDPRVLERLEPDVAGPALAARWRAGRHPYSGGWTAAQLAEAKRAWPTMLGLVRTLHARGVLLTAGTDYENPWMTPGVAFHRELQLLAAAGIPPLQVLRIATRNGAEALGVLGETGTVEAGKRADLVVLTADPLADLANTRRIARVYLRGTPHEPARLRAAP
jgi:imidazolonepropionase-like amidohydrolase